MKHLLRFTLLLIILTGGLYYLHESALLPALPQNFKSAAHIRESYTFLFLLYLGSYAMVWSTWRIAPSKAGFAFLGLSLIKIMIAVAFLWEPLHAPEANKEGIVLQFMLPYIILLVAEVYEVQKPLKAAHNQNSGQE